MFWQKRSTVFWTQHEVYAKAFRTLARGLWLSLGGMALVVVAALIFGLPLVLPAVPILKDASKQIVVTATVVLAVGAVLSLWGKWTCFELQQPLEMGQRLPGHRYLQAAFWCEVLSFVLKTSARALGVAQLKALNLPLAIVSQIAFLLFLRKVADVIDRPELKRRVDLIGMAAAGSTLAMEGLFIARVAKLGPAAMLGFIAASGLLLLITLVGYVVLLAQFALASSAFARYLEQQDGFDDAYEDLEDALERPVT